MSPALLLALLVGAAPPADKVAAKAGPILFGGGDRVYLMLAPYQPGSNLVIATVRLTHPEIVAGRSWDDAGYRFATGADPAALRVAPGTRFTGNLWRYGAQFPEGVKAFEGVVMDVVRVDTVPASDNAGLRYRGFGTAQRFYIVHAGKAFVQVLRTQGSAEITAPPEGLGVKFDRPGKTAATRLLPTEMSQVRMSNGQMLRLVGQAELVFIDGGPLR
jgi:hypothetical protein